MILNDSLWNDNMKWHHRNDNNMKWQQMKWHNVRLGNMKWQDAKWQKEKSNCQEQQQEEEKSPS